MNDTAQNPIPTDQQQSSNQNQVQTSASVPTGKEAAPVAIPKPQEQWVEETAPEAKIAEELQEAGIEATKGEVLEMHPDVAQTGVQPTGIATPVPTEPTLKLPITEEKARKMLIHKKVRDSLTWLAMLVMRQIKQMQFKRKGKTSL